MNELYLHLHTVNHDGMTFIDTRSERFYDRLQRRRLELTQATPDQPMDDEAVYLNVAGECPKGRVYGLGSLGRKKKRYADPGASTSQMPEMVPRVEIDIVADQLRKITLAVVRMTFRLTLLFRIADVTFACLSMKKPSPGLPSTHHRRVACSFRDQALFQIFQICLSSLNQLKTDGNMSTLISLLQELALSLALKCLSFDFVGTSLDESSEEFGTLQVSNAWRPVLEDPSNLQIFFDYYAIAKPPISKERDREIFFAVREYLSVYPGEGSIKRREYSGHFAIAISFTVEWIYYELYPYPCRVFPGSSIALSEWIRDWKLQSLLRVLLVSVVDMIFWSGVALTLVKLNCSEGAVVVDGSHGFRNLAGSVVQLLDLVGDTITSREANTFSV
ncbi:hypothetical protein Syun_007160 [Stephania yunnanensis]|uniref:Uncharacterized protein n=1 Tax=Stephania yunnanensis TaxID=152371 RepID=A0AAP0KZR4_9MAGN